MGRPSMLILAVKTKSYTHSAVMASRASRSGLAVRVQAAALAVLRAGAVVARLQARGHGVRLHGRTEQIHQAADRRKQDTAPLRELDACALPAPGRGGVGARQREQKGDDHKTEDGATQSATRHRFSIPAGHPEKPPRLPVPASQPLLQMIWKRSYNVRGPTQAVVCSLSEQRRSNHAQCLGWSQADRNRE